jgi:hypothetical protein
LLVFTAGVLVLVPVVSGPLVGSVDPTPSDGGPGSPGEGDANVTVESLATEDISLQRGRFGSGTYHPEGPDSRVRVHDV